jgi:hypothetical protein
VVLVAGLGDLAATVDEIDLFKTFSFFSGLVAFSIFDVESRAVVVGLAAGSFAVVVAVPFVFGFGGPL